MLPAGARIGIVILETVPVDGGGAKYALVNTGSNAGVAYDNLPIKAYIYPLDEVKKAHNLSEWVPTSGGEAAICPEDGYLLLDIAK